MKTKIKRHSRSVISVILAVCMLISCMTVGIIATDAAKTADESLGYSFTFNGGQIYFDASRTGYSSNHSSKYIYLATFNNDSSWAKPFVKMTNISNTGLYYATVNNSWNLESNPNFGVVVASSSLTINSWTNRNLYHLYYVNSHYTFNSNDNYLMYKSDISNGPLTTVAASGSSTYSDGIDTNTSYKFNQKIYAQYKAVGSSSYTSGTTGGTVSISGYKWKNGTTVESGSANHNGTLSAVRTTTATFTNSAVTGYTFDGWFTTSTGSTTISSPLTNITAAHNIYGRFSENANTVTFTKKLGSDSATTMGTASAGVTTKASYTAPDESGYEFTGWTITSGSANASNTSATNDASVGTFSLNAKGAVTVQANYVVAQTTHNVTFTNKPANGTVTVNGESTSPQAVVENQNFTVLAKPDNGYTIDTFTVGGTDYKSSLTGNDNDGYTYSGSVGTTDKTVVATFKKQSYALNYTNAANQHTFDVKVDGSSITSGSSVEYGKTVNVTVNGYDDSNGTIYIINSVTGQTLTSVSGSGTKTYSGTFTMPASAVTLTATSVPTYRVNFTGDSNITVTVRKTSSSGAVVSNGDYVAKDTKLYVAATAASGYELNNSIGVILTQGTATGTTIPYSGTINAVTAPVTINVTSKKITQYTVTLQNGTNVTGYKVSYTKNKATVSNADYSSPITVDAGSTVTATATVSNNTRYSVDKWSVNDTEQANSDNNTFTTAAINAATKLKADADKRSDYVYVYSTFFSQDPKDWLKINGTLLKDYTYSYDSKTMIVTVYGLTEGEQITFSQDNPSHTVTATGTITYGNLYTLSATNNVWQTQVEVAGDYDTVTTLLISKWYWDAAFENIILRDQSWVSGVYVWSNSGSKYYKPLGDGDNNECTNNLYNNGDVARVEYIDGEPYYAMTIRNSEFGEGVTTFKYKLYNGNKDDHTPDPTTALAVGYTYIIKAHKDNNTYTVDVSPEEGGNVPVVPTSDYYLDGWTHVNNSAFSKVDNSLRMMVGTLDEGSYSYYKVNTLAYSGHGDTGLSLFAVKTPENATVPTAASNEKYMYILGSDRFAKDDTYLGYSTDGTNFTEVAMTFVNNDNGNKLWKYPVPSNITKFYLKTIVDGNTYYASNNSANYDVASGVELSYQVYGWENSSFVVNHWDSGQSDVQTQGASSTQPTKIGNYYVWNTDSAYSVTSPHADLFQSDGNLHDGGYDDNSSAFDLPFHTNTTAAGYYVIVLHPGQTYSKEMDDGTTVTYTSNATRPTIYTSSVLPGQEMPLEPVKNVYAKDGALRNGYQRFSEFGETVITAVKDTSGTDVTSQFTHTRKDWESDNNTDYDLLQNVPYGYTIEWKTTLGTGKYDGRNEFKSSHYVRGFSVNGVTEALLEPNDTGVYTGSHVVSKQDSRRGHIEITPIYWLKNATYTKTFYVEGFDRDDNAFRSLDWGDELGVYPYYENINGADNAFGGYPGQPMIFYKGTYVQQIPTTVTGLAGGAKVKGLTLSNNYWDMMHRSINAADPIYPVKHHRQTYDFDDFYEIANEKAPLSITFSYRLRDKNDNFTDGAETRDQLTATKATATVSLNDYKNNKNGTEDYLDAIGRKIDLFGNTVQDANLNATPLLVITNGYKNTYVGKYATEWAVYKQQSGDTYELITTISPSALEVNSSTKLSDYGAGAYKSAYTTLEAYKGTPVLISFEKSQENTTGDVADRLDGRWYYTKTTDQVEANIVIEYDNGNGTYQTDTFKSTDAASNDRHVGTTTGASAYFTNLTPNDIYGNVTSGKTMLTAGTQYFYLKAEESSSYQFVGWYTVQDGKYIPMDQETGVAETHTIIKKSETYYARFKKISSGSLTVKHVIDKNSTYNGSGTPYLSAQILDSKGTVVANFPDATGSNFFNNAYIKNIYADYDVKVTIHTTPDEDNVFNTYDLNFILAEGVTTPRSAKSTFFTPNPGTITNSGECTFTFKVGALYDSNLSNQEIVGLEYVSRLTKTEYHYNFEINYTYPTRIWNDQTFRVRANIDPDRVANYIDGKQSTAKLKKSFIENMTPYESNFRQVITWDYDTAYNSGQTTTGSGTDWTITVNVRATATQNNTVHAEFKLPYAFNKADEHFAATEYDFYSTTPSYTDKTAEEYETLYKADVANPDVNTYGTTPIAPTATQQKTTVDGAAQGVGYYDSGASITLTSDESHVFNTDNSVTTDRSAMKMVTAPDYVYMVNGNNKNIAYHTYRVPAYYYSYDAGKEGYNYGYKDFNDGIIANNIVKKYFTRWDVYVDGKIITSCYSKEFNFTAYQDIIVVPVFDSDQPNANVSEADSQGAKASITFLGNTRNQWNVKGEGLSNVTIKVGGQTYSLTGADRIFSDFDLEFADGRNVFETIDGTQDGSKKYEVGVVIEQVGNLETLGDGYDTSASTYADKYKGTYNAESIKAWINDGNKPSGTFIKSVIGNNFGDDDTKRLDKNDALISNKNTIEYYYFFNKSRSYDKNGDTTANNYEENTIRKAYRAVAYVKIWDPDTNSWTVTLSDSPAYFTIYDEAMRTK